MLTFLEYAPGGTLEKEVKGFRRHGSDEDPAEAPTETRIAELGLTLLKISEDLYLRWGILHMDLKPDNLLLDEEGGLMAADFNSGKEIIDLKLLDLVEGRQEERMWSAKDAVCAMRYMAPEVEKREPFNDKAQVYSIGLILVELQVGTDILQHVVDMKLPAEDVVQLLEGWTDEGKAFLKHMLAEKSEDRPTSVKLSEEWMPAARKLQAEKEEEARRERARNLARSRAQWEEEEARRSRKEAEDEEGCSWQCSERELGWVVMREEGEEEEMEMEGWGAWGWKR